MIEKLTVSSVAILLALGAGFTSAKDKDELGGVTVTAAPRTSGGLEARAVSACGEAVLNKLIPGFSGHMQVRVPNTFGHDFIVKNLPNPHYEVGVTASYARTREVLATASCTVDRDGAIEAMKIDTKMGAALAGLKPKDIRFAMLIR